MSSARSLSFGVQTVVVGPTVVVVVGGLGGGAGSLPTSCGAVVTTVLGATYTVVVEAAVLEGMDSATVVVDGAVDGGLHEVADDVGASLTVCCSSDAVRFAAATPP